jgi:integrase
MRFPKVIRHRKSEVRIYGRSAGHPYYRISFHASGKRHIKSFRRYSDALEEAETKVRELADGHPNASLSRKDGVELLAIHDALSGFHARTGKTVTPVEAVVGYIGAVEKLGERSLSECVDAYLQSIVTVKPKLLSDAVREFIKGREPLTIAPPGKRPQLHPVYHADVSRFLTQFADMFQNHKLTDVGKEHVNLYMQSFPKLSPKSRNDRRAALKQFFRWCVASDYLSPSHRLNESPSLKKERNESRVIDYYRPNELRALLENSSGSMRAIIAMQGLAGLRLAECLRLRWRDVFTIPGHIEIGAAIAKGRARRLVEIVPSLERWLEPYRRLELDAGVSEWESISGYIIAFRKLRESLKVQSRENGLRHAYVTYHYALNGNENATAVQAGNSPQMIHEHYRGLATKAEAERWFAIAPGARKNIVPLRRSKQG